MCYIQFSILYLSHLVISSKPLQISQTALETSLSGCVHKPPHLDFHPLRNELGSKLCFGKDIAFFLKLLSVFSNSSFGFLHLGKCKKSRNC